MRCEGNLLVKTESILKFDGGQIKEQMKFPGGVPKELSSVNLSTGNFELHSEPLASV